MQRASGVISTRVGFTGGLVADPTYQEVCKKQTGHAEAVEVQYDPQQTTFEDLAKYFFNLHDPTIDRTGKGGQYRSAIFYHDKTQQQIAMNLINDLKSRGYVVQTTLEAAGEFYPAGARHQKYCNSRSMTPKDYFMERF
ncbi:MAG: peptide-methionine (S)-S-oxide reductase MsrA [Saprospiraceae bacterium]